ncbi:TPA: hypothetical protein RJD49_000603, partial [Legionella pneumophila]|nr:hypothetical protein [Legionella pneumophila]
NPDDKEGVFNQLSEMASLIKEETLEAMLKIYEVGSKIHTITKVGNPDEYTRQMAPPMIALKELIDKMDKSEKMALKIFMDNMPYDYSMLRATYNYNPKNTQNISLLESDLLNQLKEGKCGSGFEDTMKTLPYLIRGFKNANQAIEAQNEEKETNTP